jgi:hypothetical protein
VTQRDLIEALRGLEAAREALGARQVSTDAIDATELQILRDYAGLKGRTPRPENQPISDPCTQAASLPEWMQILLGCF